MSKISESLKILSQNKVSMTDLSKVYKNVKGKIEGVTWQSVKSKASRPLLKELLRSKAMKKMATKEVKARKRDDEETKEEMKRIEAVGKAVKKATRKDKGKLGELVEWIENQIQQKRNILL